MRKFLLFLAGLAAAILLIVNIGPMILLGVSLWLVYLVFKQFMKATSSTKKVLWVILGLIILSVSISNVYAVIGIAAGFVLYYVIKNWHDENSTTASFKEESDPFTNFEQQWYEINK